MKFRVYVDAVVEADSADAVYFEVAGRLSEYLEIREARVESEDEPAFDGRVLGVEVA